MEVTVEHLGAVQFEIKARQHAIACDQPAENGGFDEGMTPPELLLASLASCAGFYAASYMKNHGFNLSLGVSVSAEKVPGPARLDKFHVEIDVPGLPPEHEAGLLRSVNACLIKHTLAQPPQIETVVAHALTTA